MKLIIPQLDDYKLDRCHSCPQFRGMHHKTKTNGSLLAQARLRKVRLAKLNKRARPKVHAPPVEEVNPHLAYRKQKSEMVAEMLFDLWDKEPEEYDLERVVKRKWKRMVMPLAKIGVDEVRLLNDMGFYYND